MLAKLAVLAVKYRALIELVKAWWERHKAKKAQKKQQKDLNGF